MSKKILWEQYKQSFQNPESYVSMGLGLLVVIVGGMLIFNLINRKNVGINPGDNQTSKEPQSEAIPALPATYKVVAGESLWTIAEKYYHSGYNWTTIAEANKLTNPDNLVEGQTLTIPKAKVIMPTVTPGQTTEAMKPASIEKIEGEKYTIKAGDDLWGIALRAYGDGFAWEMIAKANNLSDPNLIHVDNTLKIPRP